MAVKMRLRREGKRKQPFYRVVVADSRSPRDGRFIEDIGYYHPLAEPSEISIDRERALHWLRNGVQASEAVVQLLRIQGVWEEFKPGDPGRDRTAKHAKEAQRRAAKAQQAEQAAKAEQAEAPADQADAPSEETVAQAVEEDTQPEPGPAEETGAIPEGADEEER